MMRSTETACCLDCGTTGGAIARGKISPKRYFGLCAACYQRLRRMIRNGDLDEPNVEELAEIEARAVEMFETKIFRYSPADSIQPTNRQVAERSVREYESAWASIRTIGGAA